MERPLIAILTIAALTIGIMALASASRADPPALPDTATDAAAQAGGMVQAGPVLLPAVQRPGR